MSLCDDMELRLLKILYQARLDKAAMYRWKGLNGVVLSAGTLTPIVKNPDEAFMSEQVSNHLQLAILTLLHGKTNDAPACVALRTYTFVLAWWLHLLS